MSAIIGSVALSALSLSITLAWYASSDRLNVSGFDVSIVASHNLLISTAKDLGTFKETLEKEELNDVDLFVPASSMNKHLWMDQKSDTPLFYDNSFYNVPATGIPQIKRVERGFYQQKIYLLSDFSYNITLDTEETSFLVNEEANQKRAEELHKENPALSVEEYRTYLDNLVNCIRLSILVTDEKDYAYYIVDPYKKENEVTKLAGRLDNDNDGYYDTYEYLSEDRQIIEKETMYGEIINRDDLVYDEPTGEPVVTKEEIEHFHGNSFKGESKGSAYTYNEQKTLEGKNIEDIYAIEDSFSMADVARSDTKLLIPCEAGVPKEIVVSIYLEGWDLDCVNATMGASFIDKISFKLAKGGVE